MHVSLPYKSFLCKYLDMNGGALFMEKVHHTQLLINVAQSFDLWWLGLDFQGLSPYSHFMISSITQNVSENAVTF